MLIVRLGATDRLQPYEPGRCQPASRSDLVRSEISGQTGSSALTGERNILTLAERKFLT